VNDSFKLLSPLVDLECDSYLGPVLCEGRYFATNAGEYFETAAWRNLYLM